MTNHVAIVGAGMAGLAAARRLRAAGIGSTLFDKGRGIGGRMATRRIDDLHFDHGAQYFTARGPRFRELVDTWLTAGHAAEWFDGSFVGMPGMSAPMRAMIADQTVVSGCQVTALRRDETGWTVLAADSPVATPGNGRFPAVILALPAPQIEPLIESAGLAFPELAAVRYAPCWTLMLAFRTPIDLPDDRLHREDGAISWIARNAGKPGRDRAKETVVVHAAPDWSRRHLECSPQEAERQLLPLLHDPIGIREAPVFAAAHRWRHARVEQSAGVAFLWHENIRIGACGDWCLGPRVEAAFDSGDALAEAVIRSLENFAAKQSR